MRKRESRQELIRKLQAACKHHTRVFDCESSNDYKETYYKGTCTNCGDVKYYDNWGWRFAKKEQTIRDAKAALSSATSSLQTLWSNYLRSEEYARDVKRGDEHFKPKTIQEMEKEQ